MTDEELISKICHIVKQNNYSYNVFGNTHVDAVAAYCMGVSSTDPYANFYEDVKPWSPIFQAARVMGLFDNSPAALSIALILYTEARGGFTPLQRDNFYAGLQPLVSDYTSRKLTQIREDIPGTISRTFNVVLQIVQLAKVLNVIESTDQSMELGHVMIRLKHAKETLIPFCNHDVDANPLAKTILEALIERIEAKL